MNLSTFKDEQLDHLAQIGNVAQFVSFGPNGSPRFSHMLGHVPDEKQGSKEQAISSLLAHSRAGQVNIRSFRPEQRQGNEFIYGISNVHDAVSAANRLNDSGMYVIVNETIDVNDGGVSGVAQGGLYEFAPGATPRIVETGAVATLQEKEAKDILSSVYGVKPALPEAHDLRVEFSIHPQKCGVRRSNTLLWEAEETDVAELSAPLRWPNLFSELVGDKAFGLLVADAFGYPVPRTNVFARKIPPFSFGRSTGEDTLWLRTAPRQAEPGLYPTSRGWIDPFKMMEDPANSGELASLLIQEEVRSQFSGALISSSSGGCLIEGVAGFGDDFMLGRSGPAVLPDELSKALNHLHEELRLRLGGIRVEWAYDHCQIWILQLQQIGVLSAGKIIVPGHVDKEFEFEVSRGLEELRSLIPHAQAEGAGIRLLGEVGMTSHLADVLRRSRVPSRIV